MPLPRAFNAFDVLLFGIREIINSADEAMPERSALKIIGMSFTDDAANNRTIGTVALTDATHGDLAGGTLHDEADGSAAGFMPSAHWLLVQNATPNAGGGTVVKRSAGDEIAVGAVIAPSHTSANGVAMTVAPGAGGNLTCGLTNTQTLIRGGTVIKIDVSSGGEIYLTYGNDYRIIVDDTGVTIAGVGGGGGVRIEDGKIGFFGTGAVTQQTVTGDTTTDLAALQGVVQSMLVAFANMNLIANSATMP